jgi:hypothetical protein
MRAADLNKPPVRFRKLRIASSVFWGIICLLVIVLWVRSYYGKDSINGCIPPVGFYFDTFHNVLRLGEWKNNEIVSFQWSYYSDKARKYFDQNYPEITSVYYPHVVRGSIQNFQILVPYWSLELLFAAIAAAPWVRWSKRFSLRTLLIATTLVAVVLGIIRLCTVIVISR